jgi:hypothetical protein
MLALGCRENAVMFPALCWIGDRLLGPPGRGWLRGWVRVEYVVTALVVVGYFVLRSTMLDGFRLPQRPYLIPPTDPDFLPHVLEKIVYYTIGMFGYLPVIPVGGQAYLAERVFGLYGSFALLVILFLCIWWGYGFRKAWLWPLAWFLCTMLPVLPVFASGHHLYLPGVGGVLMLTAGLALAGGLVPFGRVGEPRHRPWVTGGLIAVHVVVLGFITWVWGFTYVRGPMSEDMLIEDVVERGPELKSGDQLFFINLPPLAFYAVTAIEDQTGVDDLQGHALSFATQLTRMEKASEVEIVDEHTIVLRPPAGELYYEGITGRSMLEAMGFFELPEQGVPIEAGLYTVTPTLVEEDAIGELTYRFKKRIDSPDYHFYLGSPYFLAYPLDIRLGDESVASGP